MLWDHRALRAENFDFYVHAFHDTRKTSIDHGRGPYLRHGNSICLPKASRHLQPDREKSRRWDRHETVAGALGIGWDRRAKPSTSG